MDEHLSGQIQPENHYFQGMLAAEGFIKRAIRHIGQDNLKRALEDLDNALIILSKLQGKVHEYSSILS